jgi:hypothetical protein
MQQQQVDFSRSSTYNKMHARPISRLQGYKGQQMAARAYSFVEGFLQTGFRFCHAVSRLILCEGDDLTSENARSPSCA